MRLRRYLGFKTTDMNNKRIDANSEGMNFYYASDINWGKGIARHMQNICHMTKPTIVKQQQIRALYQHLRFHKEVIFSLNGIQAIAKNDLVLYSSKGSKDAVINTQKRFNFYLT